MFIEAPRQASTTRRCSFFTPCVFFSFFQLLLLPVISASVASIRCRPSCAVPWRLTCRAWMRCSRPSVRRSSVCCHGATCCHLRPCDARKLNPCCGHRLGWRWPSMTLPRCIPNWNVTAQTFSAEPGLHRILLLANFLSLRLR